MFADIAPPQMTRYAFPCGLFILIVLFYGIALAIGPILSYMRRGRKR